MNAPFSRPSSRRHLEAIFAEQTRQRFIERERVVRIQARIGWACVIVALLSLGYMVIQIGRAL